MSIHDPFINDGTARHSERAIRLFSKAVNCSVFDVRCLDDRSDGCTFNERGMSIDAIARVIPKLRHRNVNGSGISLGHPIGATGIRMIYEVSQHLWNKAGDRQVKGAEVGLAHNLGGPGSVGCVTILANS